MLRVVNGDVKGAVISNNLSIAWGYARYKRKLRKLVDDYSIYQTTAGSLGGESGVVGVAFASPVHDGWLNENKPVADLFFPGYRFGQKHWADAVEDIYPYLSLYIRSAAEKSLYESALISWNAFAYAPLFTSPVEEEGTYYAQDMYYEVLAIFEEQTVTSVGEDGSVVSSVVMVHTADKYTFYAVSLEWLFKLPNKKFYDFVSTQGRIYYNVDTAKRSWLQFVLPAIIIIAVVVVAIFTAGAGASAFGSSSSIGTTLAAEGAATLGGTLAAIAYDIGGTALLQVVGAASYAYSAYSTITGLENIQSMMTSGVSSFVITPERNVQKLGGPVIMSEYEMHPVETEFASFARSINLD